LCVVVVVWRKYNICILIIINFDFITNKKEREERGLCFVLGGMVVGYVK
jgi:hypothetical protein